MITKYLTQILGLIFCLSVFAAETEDRPQFGDCLVEGVSADPRTLIPILASDSSSAQITGLIFNGLLKYDKDLNLTGDLAQNWEILDNGLKIVFHLKKGVFWHDGVELTSADVQFSFNKLIDPLVRTPYSGDFQKVKEFEIIDRYSFSVLYAEPFSPGLASWTMGIMPKHLLENEDLNKTGFAAHPVGSGPYKSRRWKRQEVIELAANTDYFEGRPYIGRYAARVIPDEATMFLELQTKGVDMMALSPLQFNRQTSGEFFKKNYRKYRLPSFGYTYLGYNLKDKLFGDKRVRRALNLAVDKNEIIKVVLLGMGRTLTGPFLPESWGYNKSVLEAGFNPKEALLILREAGWQDTDHDGWLDKNNKKFEFTVITNQGNELRLKTAELIQKYLKNIGIQVKIKVVEWSSFLSEFIDKRRFQAVLLGWSLSRDPDCYDIWHSTRIKEGEFNFIHYQNPEVDVLLEVARRTFDSTARAGYYHKIHALIHEDQPVMFLYVPDSLAIVSSRFKGIAPAPAGIGYNFIKWWVPKEEQRYRVRIEE